MFKIKPIFSNQHGALVMALIPYFYGIFASHWVLSQLWLGLAWLFTYLFSYPFLAIFTHKKNEKYKKWAMIYGTIATLFSLPLLFMQFSVVQFLLPILPLATVQIYYTKRKDERNLFNTIAAILIFGIVGMASFYLATQQYNFAILFHPTLFFIATTLYIKSVARERKNPLYQKISLEAHFGLLTISLFVGKPLFVLVYLLAFLRAWLVPKMKLSIKQIGLLEFPIMLIFFLCLIYS